MDHHQLLVGLHVGGDGTGAHVAVIAEDRIADIVIVRGLDMIEQDHVLQFDTVPDDAVRTDQGRTADEGAVTDLPLRSDDAGRAEIRGREHLRRPVDPDVLRYFLIVLSQRRTEGQNEFLDALQRFPGIGELKKIILCKGMIQIIQIFYRIQEKTSRT